MFKHAICGAHMLRELEGLIENHHSRWAKTLKAFLLHLYHMPFEERVKRRDQLCRKFDPICSIGKEQEPAPIKTKGKRGRYKRTKGRTLVERLIREKNAVLAFAFNPDVPFTNNLAERDIRPIKENKKSPTVSERSKGLTFIRDFRALFQQPVKTIAMSF